MSDLQRMVDHYIMEKQLADNSKTMDEKENISLTLRIPKNIVALLEHYAKEFDVTRAQFAKDTLVSATWDIVSQTKLSEEQVWDIVKDYMEKEARK